MKKRFRIYCRIVVLVILVVTMQRSTVYAKNTTQKASIKLNRSSVSVEVGNSIQLKATVTGKSKKVSWSTSNKKIATVNSKGKVTGKKTGAVTITAKANGKTVKCKVTVKKTAKKNYKYKYSYNINDFGKWVGVNRENIVITPLSAKKVKISFYNGKVMKHTYTATLIRKNTYCYVNNALYKGYKTTFTWSPNNKILVLHGFEEGDAYYVLSN